MCVCVAGRWDGRGEGRLFVCLFVVRLVAT